MPYCTWKGRVHPVSPPPGRRCKTTYERSNIARDVAAAESPHVRTVWSRQIDTRIGGSALSAQHLCDGCNLQIRNFKPSKTLIGQP